MIVVRRLVVVVVVVGVLRVRGMPVGGTAPNRDQIGLLDESALKLNAGVGRTQVLRVRDRALCKCNEIFGMRINSKYESLVNLM